MFKIDPEFQNKIPPLTEDEFRQLEENILEDGEVYEPIITWNGIIVDGHNRWKIVQKHPEIPYKTREMDFSDRWAAFDWMYKNQLGRRNLTEQMVKYLRGKLYTVRKHTVGAPSENTNAQKQCDQNEHIDCESKRLTRTAEKLAKESGVGAETIKRSEKFADAIDAIRGVSPETADSILKGEIKTFRQDMTEIAQAAKITPEIVPSMVEQIKSGQRVTKVNVPVNGLNKPSCKYNGGGTKEYREQRNKIAETATRMYDTDVKPEYKLSNLSDEIRWSAESFTKLILNILAAHQELVAENKEAIKGILDDQIINKMEEIKEDIDK